MFLTSSEQKELILWFRSYALWIKLITLTLLFGGMILFTLVLLFLPSIFLLVIAVILLTAALVVALRGLLYTPVVAEISNNGVFIVQGLLRRRLIYVPRSEIERVEFKFKQWRQLVLPSRYWFLPLPLNHVAGVVCVYPKTGRVVEFYVLREDIPPLSRALRKLGL